MNKELKSRVLSVLAEHDYIKIAILFGSHAQATEGSHSDLDLAVAADHPLTVDEKMKLMGDLTSATNHMIDLVDLQSVTGVILQQALCEGRILVKKNTLLYAGLIIKMLDYQADMMPYHDRILQERREIFLYG